MSTSIAPLKTEHARQYQGLMLQAYSDHPDAFTSSIEERAALPLNWWQDRLAGGPKAVQIVMGGWQGDDLIGVAGISFEQRKKAAHKSTLFGMYVVPAGRGSGLGRELVQAIIDLARRRTSVRSINLTVTQGNEQARRLYEQCGFVAFGVEPDAVAVDDGFVAKVHMRCDLSRG